jgi:hypothetical protein
VQLKWLDALLNLPMKSHKKFSSLEEMQAYMREQVSKQKKAPADENSEDNDDNDE